MRARPGRRGRRKRLPSTTNSGRTIAVVPGKYALHQAFHVGASHPKTCLPCKAASAEFAPDPALDPLWISAFEPFHGASKKDFGFQITLKVVSDTEAPAERIPSEPKKVKNGKP